MKMFVRLIKNLYAKCIKNWFFWLIPVLLLFFIIIVGGYVNNWRWVGVSGYKDETEMLQQGKTFWDWMELLIIPIGLIVGASLLNQSEKRAEKELAIGQRRDQILHDFIQEMMQLLVHENLKRSKEGDEIQIIAKTIILTALRSLDGKRKGLLLNFLYDGGLVYPPYYYRNEEQDHFEGLKLDKLDLKEAELKNTRMWKLYLEEPDFSNSQLEGAQFREGILSKSIFIKANLKNTYFAKAILDEANFTGAVFTIPKSNKMFDLTDCAVFNHAVLNDANLSDLDLRGAVFWGASLNFVFRQKVVR